MRNNLGFPLCVSNFLIWNLGEAEIACILGLSWLYLWDEVVLQGSLLVSSKLAISFGLLKHIS